MQKFLLTILIIILSTHVIFSQYNPGAKQISVANSDVGRANDVFSVFYNPGGITQLNHREIGIYYSPAPFGFQELANGFIAYIEPFSFGSAGLGVMFYGFELYNEIRLITVFGYNYENKFFTGASVNYHRVTIKHYGSATAFYANIGGILKLTDYLQWGFCIHNVNHASFGNYDDQIPVILDSGISVDLLNNFTINAAFEKDVRYNASISFGLDYRIVKYLSLRSGFSNEPSRYTAGIGINYLFVSLDYAVFTHSDLGLTHQAGLIISFNSKNPVSDKTIDISGVKQKK